MMARSGLTLVELVVGLVITGLALAVGYSAYATVSDRRAQAIRAMDSTLRHANIRNALVGWIRRARLTTEEGGPPFVGTDGVYGADPDDRLTFLSTIQGASGPQDVVVDIRIDRDDTTPELGLVAVINDWRGSDSVRIELVPNAVALNMQYLYGLPDGRWLPSWISSTSLPRGVALTIGVREGDSLPPLLHRSVRVALAGGW